jgi:hypothetical protein
VIADHGKSVVLWIEEGAELVLDGRDVTAPGCDRGFHLGPTLFDHLKRSISVESAHQGACEGNGRTENRSSLLRRRMVLTTSTTTSIGTLDSSPGRV